MRIIGAVLLCCLGGLSWAAEPVRGLLEFDIDPQRLSGALREFSEQSGVQVLAGDTRLVDRRVPGLRGRMAPDAALRRLLIGTGLIFRQVDGGTIVLLRGRAQPPAPALPSAGGRSGGTPAGAATEVQAPAEELAEVTEVQITGTRIQQPNVTSANPVTSISGEEMRRLGMVNVADALLQLVPQNISNYAPTLTGDIATYMGNDAGGIGGPGSGNQPFDRGSFFVGNTIANLRGMDPMFGSRTLTLVDGRRVVSTSNQADIIDLNIIPSNLLQRMDVATGGASATYGSGAMAGVVNLVLNNRLNGVAVDMDYGVNEAGDGDSPHAAFSGGMPLFAGRGHVLLGVEWQRQSAIRDCAAARDWCADARGLFQNYTGTAPAVPATLTPLAGFEGLPARFRMDHLRYSQFSPAGAIYSNNADNTSGFRFTEDGRSVEEYAFGYRGGTNLNVTLNGDGPVATSGVSMRPSTRRSSAFTNLEYHFTEHTTGYLQASYANTASLNRNPYTVGNTCVRFNTTGAAATPAGVAKAGAVVAFGGNGEALTDPFRGGAPVPDFPRSTLWSNANFRAFMGVPNGRVPPFYIPPGQQGSTDTTPPTYTFVNATNPLWQRVTSAQGTAYWNLVSVTLAADFADPGTPAVLPQMGRNAYAFLDQLSPEALYQVQRAFGNAPATSGGNSALAALYGAMPCTGFTAVRKVWNPQIQQWTSQDSQTWRAVAGLRGGFGRDWRWDAYYQYGATDSNSRARNVQTNLSFAFAMDAVIDDRPGSPTQGTPVCRIIRDGVPVLDSTGRPMSDPAGLAAVAEGCKPLNVFGSAIADPAAAALQEEALRYAFKENVSDGANILHTLSFNASGTLWQGLGAGPMTGAFGLELREDRVDNKGSRGPFYLRADISRAWGDAFGGRTRAAEGYTELDLPLISGIPGAHLWSVNAGLRYANYNNKGGAGTTGQSATQGTMNWKLSTVFEPFDWVRFRLTRSRDLRAAGYRDLFLNQPGIPDQAFDINPWRERTVNSNENQFERWGFVRVGNADLRPERSNTLTLGMVLSPGSWAQGMRLSADYYNIEVKDGIYTPFEFESLIRGCWENSGNSESAGINGLINPYLHECRDITFAELTDENGLPIAGTRDLHDIVSYNASRPVNGLPYQRRGLDLSFQYMLPLSRIAGSMPGTASLTVRTTRALEASGIQQTCGTFSMVNNTAQCSDNFNQVDQVGQIRSNVFIPGVSAAPRWTGNLTASYLLGELTASLLVRYVGGATLDNNWCDSLACSNYQNAQGQFLTSSVDRNHVAPYFNLGLGTSYNLKVRDMQQFQIFGSVSNLFDRNPPFTGGGISGASPQYHDTLGRAWRMGIRLRF